LRNRPLENALSVERRLRSLPLKKAPIGTGDGFDWSEHAERLLA